MWHPSQVFLSIPKQFLLTHPLWDVTKTKCFWCICNSISTHTSLVGCDYLLQPPQRHVYHFYSHIPCGMWLLLLLVSTFPQEISTHTSLVGCDSIKPTSNLHTFIFLLTHPLWDVTLNHFYMSVLIYHFYSHIPCGMWQNLCFVSLILLYFYSHIPCGMWRCSTIRTMARYIFLLTHPLWDVTLLLYNYLMHTTISTHTSLVGCDMFSLLLFWFHLNFYSHIPCGMWQQMQVFLLFSQIISTHTSLVGCD